MNSAELDTNVGLRWPAEWEPHEATWIAWPHNHATWPNKLEDVARFFTKLVRILSEVELVHVLAGGNQVVEDAARHLQGMGNVVLHDIVTNDAWIRDFGPTFVQRSDQQKLVAINWRYNAWGEKYRPFDSDQAAGARVAEFAVQSVCPNVVVEGGAIETNGAGLVLSTKSCLLNPNRNPNWIQRDIERVLLNHLGGRELIWLPKCNLANDDTDGHVDQLARFVDENKLVVASCRDSRHPDYEMLFDYSVVVNDRVAKSLTPPHIIELPVPHVTHFGKTLPASYCNFYFANEIVIVPTFGETQIDDLTLGIFADLLPNRNVIGLDCRDLLIGLGAVHCVTLPQCRVAGM